MPQLCCGWKHNCALDCVCRHCCFVCFFIHLFPTFESALSVGSASCTGININLKRCSALRSQAGRGQSFPNSDLFLTSFLTPRAEPLLIFTLDWHNQQKVLHSFGAVVFYLADFFFFSFSTLLFVKLTSEKVFAVTICTFSHYVDKKCSQGSSLLHFSAEWLYIEYNSIQCYLYIAKSHLKTSLSACTNK